MWRKIRRRADRFDIRSNSLEENWRQDTRRYLAADSAARRLQFSCTEVGTTQSSVQRKQQDPTKDLADEIRALLKQRHRSDSPRQIEGTRQYIRRHLAADTEVTPPDRLKVLGSTLGDTWQQTQKWLPQTDWRYLAVHWKHLAAGSAARRLQLSCTGAGSTQSSVQKTAGPYKKFGGRNQGLAGTKPQKWLPQTDWRYLTVHQETPGSRHRSDHLKQIEGTRQYIRRHLAANREVTSPDRLKVLGSTLEALGRKQCSPATRSTKLSTSN